MVMRTPLRRTSQSTNVPGAALETLAVISAVAPRPATRLVGVASRPNEGTRRPSGVTAWLTTSPSSCASTRARREALTIVL